MTYFEAKEMIEKQDRKPTKNDTGKYIEFYEVVKGIINAPQYPWSGDGYRLLLAAAIDAYAPSRVL